MNEFFCGGRICFDMKKIIFIFIFVPFVAFAQSCPTGMVAVEYDNYVVADAGACPAGYVAHDVTDSCSDASTGVCWLVEQMRALCGAGIDKIKTSTGVVVPLYSGRVTTPSFCVRYNDTVCYADMVLGRASGAVNVEYGDAVYHLE